MHQYRVTKYDPEFRDSSGAFTRDDWTATSDIGGIFGGVVLTPQAYLTVENAYVESAIAFLSESSSESLKVASLENYGQYTDSVLEIADGKRCTLLEIADIARLNLRSLVWCRFSGDDAFLHFGGDFYMYVGVPMACQGATNFAKRSGLFVESFNSPYLENGLG